jgi:hypothetical protein
MEGEKVRGLMMTMKFSKLMKESMIMGRSMERDNIVGVTVEFLRVNGSKVR